MAPRPLSPAQRMIWLAQSLAPESPAYNMTYRWDLSGTFDPSAFLAALATVAEGTESLRMRVIDAPEPAWDVGPPPALPRIESVDSAGMENAIAQQISAPFDLREGVLRWRLFETPTGFTFVKTVHHIATDAVAGALFWDRVIEALGDGEIPANPQDPWAEAPLSEHWSARIPTSKSRTEVCGRVVDPSKTASHRTPLPFGDARAAQLRSLQDDARFRCFGDDLLFFTALTTLFAAFAARAKDQDHITISAPAAMRRTPEEKAFPGLRIEMLPLSIPVEEDASFASLFDQVRTEIMGWMRNATPGVVRPALIAGADAALNYIPTRMAAFPGCESHFQWLHPGAQDGAVPLWLQITDFNGTGTPQLAMDVKSEVLSPEGANIFGAQFLRFFDEALTNRDAPLRSLPLTDLKDPRASISRGPDVPGPSLILEQFAAQVLSRPDAPAIKDANGCVSYVELDAQSTTLAAALCEAGVPQDGTVALWAQRSPALITAVLATLKAGATFALIPCDAPPARLAAILEQLKPDLLLCDDPAAAPAGVRAVPFNGLIATAPLPARTPAEVAYILFTSGSTGKPKGVAVPGAGLARFIDWVARTYGPVGPTSYAFCTSIGFDMTLSSLFAPLVSGGALHIYPDPTDGPDLAVLEALKDDAVDVIKLTPSHLALAVEGTARRQRLHTLTLQGENLPTETCRRAHATLGDHIIITDEYGPTEAIIGCMLHTYDPDLDRGASVPIGRAADATEIRIVDTGLNVVPCGFAGELLIGGPDRLASGYLGLPEMTADRFVTLPDCPDMRFYRSGDKARMDDAGVIHYLGRSDGQLKRSGVRIEVAEIEDALLAYPGVTHAAAVLRKDRLIAYVAGRDFTDADLLSSLRDRLPREALPDQIVMLASLPLNASGKIDRAALPDPAVQTTAIAVAPPQTESEHRLAALIARFMPDKPADMAAHFLDIGGDSMAAVRIAMAAQEDGFDLTPGALFEQPSLRALAATLGRTEPKAPSPEEPLLTLDAGDSAAVARALAGLSRGG